MKQFLDASGFWAPVIFILIYILAICLFVPGTIITALGAAIFGPYWGFVYVLAGAILGATVTFFIGRYLGRDFAASVIGDRLKKYDQAIERNGFATVLYLRLIYFPFTAMDFGMGLTRDLLGLFLGYGPGYLGRHFVFTFFVGTIKEVWASGDWGHLLSGKVFLSIGLFIFSLFIPKIIKRFKKVKGYSSKLTDPISVPVPFYLVNRDSDRISSALTQCPISGEQSHSKSINVI